MSTEPITKWRPALFNAAMVNALLDLTKTKTRRTPGLDAVNKRAGDWSLPVFDRSDSRWVFTAEHGAAEQLRIACPYGQPGDRLWVRETWRTSAGMDDKSPKQIAALCEAAGYSDIWAPLRYEADGATDNAGPIVDAPGRPRWGKTRVSIHMPRWASRISLEITDVRVERLHDISESDARTEGIRWDASGPLHAHVGLSHVDGAECNFPTAFDAYRALWEDINGYGSWDINPHVWCLTFKRVEQ